MIKLHSERLHDIRAELRRQLRAAAASHAIDQLLCHQLGYTKTQLYTHSHRRLSPAIKQKLLEQLSRWRAGVPLAYVLGHCQFYARRFAVSAHSLIPRPETEQLVECALLHAKPGARVLDLGTGCGVIAISMACENKGLAISASDICADCLALARRNAAAHAIDSIRWLHSDWFQQIPAQTFDVIVSNPPYVARHDPHVDGTVVKYEPARALFAGHDGLSALRVIIGQARQWLTAGGVLLLEHGWRQAQAVADLIDGAGLSQRECLRDHNGHPRISVAFCPLSCGASARSTRLGSLGLC